MMEKQVARYVCDLFAVGAHEVQTLNHFLYPFKKDGREYMARVLAEPDLTEQQTEVRWLDYLAERGVGMVRPLPSVNGALLECVEIDGVPHGLVALQKALGAPPTAAEWNPALWKKLGRTIGQLHEVTVEFHGEYPELKRAPWHGADIYDSRQLPAEFDLARGKIDALVELVRSLPQDNENYGLVHGDIHQWNFHLHAGEILFYDTDECEMNYYAFDLGVLIYFSVVSSFNGRDVNDYAEAFIGNLLEGYAERRSLSGEWVERLPVFIKLREMMSFIDAFIEWDIDKLSFAEKNLLMYYQNAIENEVPVLHIDFKQFR